MKHAPGGHKTARHLHLFGRLRRQGASPAQSPLGEQQPLTSTRPPRCSSPGLCGVLPRQQQATPILTGGHREADRLNVLSVQPDWT
ncbi:hypothetical protein RRG08_033251 [Elysia crispata]|uniref:Uncharacterized protein n=1 Tax=Elysia crispata TaxID=231223 RepID=A0AAE0ZBH6_9GAST|nr:hypothetical protein RRG08_033251 [Elysia crispata]